MVTVRYRWHPHFNLTLPVRQMAGQSGAQLLCELPDGTLGLIPRWMTEVEECAGLSLGSPQVSVAALRRLRELADKVARGRVQTTGTDDACEPPTGRES